MGWFLHCYNWATISVSIVWKCILQLYLNKSGLGLTSEGEKYAGDLEDLHQLISYHSFYNWFILGWDF